MDNRCEGQGDLEVAHVRVEHAREYYREFSILTMDGRCDGQGDLEVAHVQVEQPREYYRESRQLRVAGCCLYKSMRVFISNSNQIKRIPCPFQLN